MIDNKSVKARIVLIFNLNSGGGIKEGYKVLKEGANIERIGSFIKGILKDRSFFESFEEEKRQ